MSSKVQQLNERSRGKFPELIGMQIIDAADGVVRSRMIIKPQLLAPNGFLHAASIVGLADTTCGYGAMLHLPPGAEGFTTLELKSNFLGTVRDGEILCEARLMHKGRSTQVWDARILFNNSAIALFRCTQLILYPRLD